jgi:hypothetical protein
MLSYPFEGLPHGAGLPHRLLGDLKQVRTEGPLLGDRGVRLATDHPIERLQGALHRAHAVAEEGALAPQVVVQQRLGARHEAGEDADTVTQEPAIGGIVEGGSTTVASTRSLRA